MRDFGISRRQLLKEFIRPDTGDRRRDNKRRLDIAGATAALSIFHWKMSRIAKGVKKDLDIEDPIFRQERAGQYGIPFKILKFQTMQSFERASKGDPSKPLSDYDRTTTLGRRLRNSHQDELPQFYNVLRGEMSMVGPRPLICKGLNGETGTFIVECEEVQMPIAVLDAKPGVTGPWSAESIRTGKKVSVDKLIELELDYANKPPSILRDIWLVAQTVPAFLQRKTGKTISTKPLLPSDLSGPGRMAVSKSTVSKDPPQEIHI